MTSATPRNILGISAYYHDSAAALLRDGELIAAAQQERFTRKKHDAGFPAEAIRYCLEAGDLDLAGIDRVVFYDKPLIKFERLLETYLAFAPRGFSSFRRAMPIWLKEKLFLKRTLQDEIKDMLKAMAPDAAAEPPGVLFAEHHQSHAASAFFPSPFDEALILTMDGVGEWATCTLGFGQGKQIEMLDEIRYPHSLGLLYSAFTYYCGFKVNSGEYKLMGLAAYGDPNNPVGYIAKVPIGGGTVTQLATADAAIGLAIDGFVCLPFTSNRRPDRRGPALAEARGLGPPPAQGLMLGSRYSVIVE